MAVVLITGANRGIGLELTRIYAAAGDTVLACCRDVDGATALGEVSGDVEIYALDVTSAESVARLADTLRGRPVDLLINNAGTLGPDYAQQTATTMDFEGWSTTFEVNSIGPVRVMHAILENLKASDNPRVASITSQMGALALDTTMAYAYCSSKAALNKYMKLAAIDLADDGIKVCVIHPGWVQTDMGGANADITPQASAAGIVETIKQLNAKTSGSFWKWDGEAHAW